MIQSLQYFLDNLKIEAVVLVTFLYLLVLWLLVPAWVYLDAKKRFANKNIPYLLFLLIFPLNIPGLVFYIIIRPEHPHTDSFDGNDDSIINVPIVKFLDESNDFVMSFDLRINGKLIDKTKRSNLNMNLSIDPDEQTVTVIEEKKGKDISFSKKEKDVEESKLKENPFETFRGKVVGTLKEVKGFFILEEDENETDLEVKASSKNASKKQRK